MNPEKYKDYRPQADALKGKIILITGAGSGIGKTLALGLAQYGATIVLCGKTLKKLEQVYDEIVANGFPQPAITPLDLETATEKDYQELQTALGNEFGRLDGVVFNAAILGELTPLEFLEQSIWDKVIQVNLTSTFLLAQAILPLLKQSPSASMLFTSSSVGRKARAYWGSYAVSKFGVEALMQILADELEENTSVRSNSINPGATRTNMRAEAFPGEDKNSLPLPEQLLPAYLYLLSDDSQNINGKAFNARDFFTF